MPKKTRDEHTPAAAPDSTETLLAASSFGSAPARAVIARVPPERAAAVRDRAHRTVDESARAAVLAQRLAGILGPEFAALVAATSPGHAIGTLLAARGAEPVALQLGMSVDDLLSQVPRR